MTTMVTILTYFFPVFNNTVVDKQKHNFDENHCRTIQNTTYTYGCTRSDFIKYRYDIDPRKKNKDIIRHPTVDGCEIPITSS